MRKVASFGIVLMGLYALVLSPQLGSFAINTFTLGQGSPWLWVLGVFPFVTTVALGVALIASRHRLAAAWFDDGVVEIGVDPQSLLRLGLTLLGVYVIVISATSAVGTLALLASRWLVASSQDLSLSLGGPTVADLIPSVVQAGIGVALVWFSEPLAHRLWLGTAAPKPVPEPPCLLACPSCGATYDPADYMPGVEHRCVACGETLPPARA